MPQTAPISRPSKPSTENDGLAPHRWQQLWQFTVEQAGSAKAVAAACGVHQSTITRAGSNPKANLVRGGADVLGWSVDDVYDFCRESQLTLVGGDDADPEVAIERLEIEADACNSRGDYHGLVAIGKTIADHAATMLRSDADAANSDVVAARGWLRVAQGMDGLGFCEESERAARRGLEACRRAIATGDCQAPETSAVRLNELELRLTNNIATALYHQGFYTDARMYAQSVLDRLQDAPPETAAGRKSHAFVYLLLGHIDRACIETAGDQQAERLARRAAQSLTIAKRLLDELAEEASTLAPMSRLADNGLLEAWVELGEVTLDDALAQVTRRNDEVDDVLDRMEQSDGGKGSGGCEGIELEAIAWSSLFMAGLVNRLRSPRQADEQSAPLLAVAMRVGRRLNSWAILKRVAEIKFGVGRPVDGVALDEDDRSLLIGLVSRFPSHREFAFNLLKNARHVTTCASRRAS